ncbi:hypothetical protein BFINE_28530 [Bacteroides finegoldii DSM 17565]|nr:hypothetical protein BFINE_28530 [Bacteroides finegoldii DSM 17565]
MIHERVEAEAKRLLLYSNKSAKEIADILGFEDQASFSRFFKNISGQSAVQFRNTQERKIDKGYGSIAIGKILEKYDLCGVS